MRYGKLGLAILLGSLCVASMPARAQTYYTSRTLFNAANPGLTVQTFETAPVNTVVLGIYNTSTSGLQIDAPGPLSDEIYINNTYGSSFDTSLVATTNYIDNTADLIFNNNDVKAAGVDLYNGTYTINIYGAANTLLGTQTVDASNGAFFGVSDASVITRINLNNTTTYETYDNIAFGGVGPQSTPEPGSLALLAGMGVSGAGLLMRRRRQVRKAA